MEVWGKGVKPEDWCWKTEFGRENYGEQGIDNTDNLSF